MNKNIKNTIEFDYCIYCILRLLIYAFVHLCLGLFVFVPVYFEVDYDFFSTALILYFALFVCPFIILLPYYLFQFFSIFRIGDKMMVTEVKLDNVERHLWGSVRFLAEIPDKDGNLQEKRSLCCIRGKILANHANKTVRIYYMDDYDFFFIIKE